MVALPEIAEFAALRPVARMVLKAPARLGGNARFKRAAEGEGAMYA